MRKGKRACALANDVSENVQWVAGANLFEKFERVLAIRPTDVAARQFIGRAKAIGDKIGCRIIKQAFDMARIHMALMIALPNVGSGPKR